MTSVAELHTSFLNLSLSPDVPSSQDDWEDNLLSDEDITAHGACQGQGLEALRTPPRVAYCKSNGASRATSYAATPNRMDGEKGAAGLPPRSGNIPPSCAGASLPPPPRCDFLQFRGLVPCALHRMYHLPVRAPPHGFRFFSLHSIDPYRTPRLPPLPLEISNVVKFDPNPTR